MEIDQLLNSIRDHYLAYYRSQITSYTQQYSPGSPEVLLETKRSCDYVYRLYRIDLASGASDPPNLTEVNLGSFLDFETLQLKLNELEVQFSPIHWNGAEFNVAPILNNDSGLQQWALKWLDLDETATTDEYGLGNYIHFVTEPVSDGAFISFSVDFGSSTIEAFIELLELLAAEGATLVKVHSKSMIEAKKNDA